MRFFLDRLVVDEYYCSETTTTQAYVSLGCSRAATHGTYRPETAVCRLPGFLCYFFMYHIPLLLLSHPSPHFLPLSSLLCIPVSSPPRSIQVSEIDITSFSLRWVEPVTPNGMIIRYRVSIITTSSVHIEISSEVYTVLRTGHLSTVSL